ncbi:hypothetical protein LCGC14_1371660 [marine sediment metagenome]|uniref:Uncharacterized protein n=1 Tax=marine sediment metagenome TaxID=412755 RepID=A0A0F9K5E5_9ZZZZ
MQEITVSSKRKINTGNYQNTEIMYSLKKQVLDGTEPGPEMQKLSEEIEFILDKKEKQIRQRIEKEAKAK